MRLFKSLRARALKIRLKIKTLYFAYGDPNTPLCARVMLCVTLGYALSPVDLIPDFIPVLGYLDDLLLLPLMITLSLRLIPPEILKIAEQKAETQKIDLKKNVAAAIVIIAVWLTLLSWLLKTLVCSKTH